METLSQAKKKKKEKQLLPILISSRKKVTFSSEKKKVRYLDTILNEAEMRLFLQFSTF